MYRKMCKTPPKSTRRPPNGKQMADNMGTCGEGLVGGKIAQGGQIVVRRKFMMNLPMGF